MSNRPEPSEQNQYALEHIQLLRSSFQQIVGRELLSSELQGVEAAKALYFAPFVLVSHDTAADPVFNYGNLTAQRLFELSWSELTALPSRQSAEPPNQEERARLLEAVTRQGFIEHYAGIRIAKSGRRFRIEDVIVWNLFDAQGNYAGQAAVYEQWTDL